MVYDIATERSLLGQLVSKGSQIAQIEPVLISQDFSLENINFYTAIRALYKQGVMPDIVLVSDYIFNNQLSEDNLQTIQLQLLQMREIGCAPDNALKYAQIVLKAACKRYKEIAFNKFKNNPTEETLQKLNEVIKRIDQRQAYSLSADLVSIDFDSFINLELPPIEYIIHPIIPVGGLCLLHAAPGVGKTHVTSNIAYRVSRGGSFLDWTVTVPRGVLYVDGEMTKELLVPRLRAIKENDYNPSNLAPQPFKILNSQLQPPNVIMPDIASIEGQAMIEKLITPDIKLVVLDNLSCLIRSGDENESTSWHTVNEWLLSLRRRGIAALVIHHQGKDGTQRGTSKKEDAMDTVIALEALDDKDPTLGCAFKVKFTKHRGFYGKDALPFEARLYPKKREQWVRSEIAETPQGESKLTKKEMAVLMHLEKIPHENICSRLNIREKRLEEYLAHLGRPR